MPGAPAHTTTLDDLVDLGVTTTLGAARAVATNFIGIDEMQAAGQLWPVHSHVEHELLWGISGGLTVSTPTGSHAVPRGLSLWIPAGVPHEVHATRGTSVNCTWLAPHLTAGPGPEVTCLLASRLLEETLRHLDSPALDDAHRSRAERFAGDLVGGHPPHQPSYPLSLPLPRSADLRAIADAILDDPADPGTLGDLAAAYGLSLRTLTRRFRTETGMSPAYWRTRARIAAASRSLAGGVPVTRVAREIGFASPSAFGAAFRRVTGVSPRTYADLVAGSRQ